MRLIPKEHRAAFDAAVNAQKALNANQDHDLRTKTFNEARYLRLNRACDRAMNKLPRFLQDLAFHKALNS